MSRVSKSIGGCVKKIKKKNSPFLENKYTNAGFFPISFMKLRSLTTVFKICILKTVLSNNPKHLITGYFFCNLAASETEDNRTLREKALHYKQTAPPADIKKRKRGNAASLADSELATKLSRLESMGAKLLMSEAGNNSGALSSIQFALDFVPKDMQLQYVMEMMAVAQRYSRMSREGFYSSDRSPTSPSDRISPSCQAVGQAFKKPLPLIFFPRNPTSLGLQHGGISYLTASYPDIRKIRTERYH